MPGPRGKTARPPPSDRALLRWAASVSEDIGPRLANLDRSRGLLVLAPVDRQLAFRPLEDEARDLRGDAGDGIPFEALPDPERDLKRGSWGGHELGRLDPEV